jgi:hypothetical protein
VRKWTLSSHQQEARRFACEGRGSLQRIVVAKFEVKEGAVRHRLDAQKSGKMDGHCCCKRGLNAFRESHVHCAVYQRIERVSATLS